MEFVDTEFGRLPPRTNFLVLKSDTEETGYHEDKFLYGVQDIINILKFNKDDAKIEEFLFIVREQGKAIKDKINEKIAENSLPVESIIDITNLYTESHAKRIIKTHGRYRLENNLINHSTTIKNLISHRLNPNIVKSIRAPVKSLILSLNILFSRLMKIKNIDGYKNVLIIADVMNQIVSNFFQNTIFKLTLEEQYEYLVTCFPRFYFGSQEDHSPFGDYIEEIVEYIKKPYMDYYNNQYIMLASVVKGRPYIKELRAGTILYRGSRSLKKRDTVPQYLFFTHNPFVALLYTIPKDLDDDLGVISAYKVQTNLRVLDFSNYHTIDYIISLMISLNAPNKVIKSIVYGWFNEGQIDNWNDTPINMRNATKPHSKITRFSETGYDFPVSEWLCSNGFNGYIGLGVKKRNGEVFHDEFMICDPSNENKVKYLGVLDKKYINYNLEVSQNDWYANILQ